MKLRFFLAAMIVAGLLGHAPGAEARISRCPDDTWAIAVLGQDCAARPGVRTSAPPGSETVPASGETHFLWHAFSPQGELYLLGSLHFGTPAMYPLPAAVMAAFRASEALVVEVNMLQVDAHVAAREMLRAGTLPRGTSLETILDAPTFAKLRQAAKDLAVPVETLERQEPWLAAMTLSVLALQKGGFDPALGIDRFFLQQAQGVKPVFELESLSQQLEMLDGLDPSVQQAMLGQALNEYEQGAAYFDTLLSYWQRGDSGGLAQLVEESMGNTEEGKALYDAFLTQRNVRMMEALLTMMEEDRVLFVVVGAAHLAGEQGIIEMLRRKGFRIQQR